MCLGIPGQVIAVADAARCLAVVDIGGVRRAVNMACVADDGAPLGALVGAWVLVHVGFAMSVVDAAEAAETLRLLDQLGEVQAERDAIAASGRA